MLHSQNRKSRTESARRVFTRASLVLLLLAVSGVGLAVVSSRAVSSKVRARSNNEVATGAAYAFVPQAVSITVDRTDDDASAAASLCTVAPNDCSLRGAVAFANLLPGTTINLPAGTYKLTIAGTGEGFSGNNSIGDLDVRGNNTSIVGDGAATTIIQQTIAGNRVIEVNPFLDSGFNFSISGVTISGGRESTGVGGGGIISGAINNTTTVTDCVFTNNSATGSGTFGGGGICNTGGSLTATRTTFSGNSTSGSGGAVSYSAGDPLGRKPSTGTLTVRGSSFTGNTAQSTGSGGGAIDVFNFNLGTTSADIRTSSFSGNAASNGRGGAVNVESGTANVSFSRLVNNTAASGGRTVHAFSGSTLTANDNWWGASTGPGTNQVFGPLVTVWLQLHHAPADSEICVGGSTTLSADIKNRNAGNTLTTELNGLPAFPSPAGTIFSNAVNGTISSASTQFVDGAATATYTATAAGAGSADATADNETATANINNTRNATSALSNQNVCEGATATFTTTSSGPGTISFVWKKNGTALNNGDLGGRVTISTSGNTSTLSISGVQTGDAGTYSVDATGDCNTDTQSTTLTVNQATDASAPADQTVCQGASANFSTTASGTGPFSYQWKLDGSNISGATNSSVSISTGSLSVGNHPVDVVVTGACGSVTKSATLTVQENTGASTPNNQTVCQGASANFSTTASGTGPFSYQWKLDGSNISGATNSSVSISTGSLSVGNHPVEVVVSGGCGSITKSATLTVQENTGASTPGDQTVCQGASASFSTTASGTGPFSYQWKLDGSNISGATNSSVSISTGSLSVGGHTVDVVVGGACGTVTRSATLTVQENTSATSPADQTVCQGASASFSTTASGTGPFSYQWKLDGSNISGATNSSVSVSTGSLSVGNHTVEVVVGGTCGSVTKSATLTVQENTGASTPNNQTVCQGASANFSTTASGTGPFSYQWKLDGSNISGATNSSVSIDTTSLSGGNHSVEVVVSGTCGSVTRSATLTVNTAPVVTTNPVDQTVTSGNVTFTAAASGSPTPSVQWQVSTNGGASFSNISGATSTSLTFAVDASLNGNKYRAVFTNACSTATTTAATLTTCSQPVVTTNPASVADACVGQVVNFTAAASGSPTPSVQWQVSTNGGATFTNISGATSTTLSVTASVAVRNYQYRAVFSNPCGQTATTSAATLGVDTTAPTITLKNQSITFWPPNHNYHAVNVTDLVASASDGCDGSVDINDVVISQVTSDEPEDSQGADGNTLNDIVIANNCKSVQLRAERDSNLDGRVYTITFKVTDNAGNTRTVTAQVQVPKNNGSTAVNSGVSYTVTSACP